MALIDKATLPPTGRVRMSTGTQVEGAIASARKGQMSQNAMTITNVMLGCMVIGGAALFYGFADNIASFVFS